MVGTKQRRPGRPLQDSGQLPGQIMRALDGGVGSPGFERRHGVRRITDEKYSPTLELVGHLLVRLPGRDLDDVDVDLLTECLGENFAATLRRELRRRLTLAGQIGGDEHTEIAL